MSLYTVSFRKLDGDFAVSRFFGTLRAARNWARWLRSQPYTAETAIHRGPAGGELIERLAATRG